MPRIWGKFQQGVLSKFSCKLDFLTSIPLLGGFIKNKIKIAWSYVARNVFTEPHTSGFNLV